MLIEVNPLAVLDDGQVVAADAKVTIDDNALYRHADLAELRDVSAADPQEQMARERGVTYVKLDGSIGILGNGAGLVMSTLDVVDQVGGSPANFLDVGGGAQADEIVAAMEVILSDPKVEAVLFNIFGGITRCDEVARGILDALDKLEVDVPLVVRLDGTNDVEGRKLLQDAAPPGAARGAHDARGRRAGRRARRERGLMAVLVTAETRLVVQGITGREGRFHTLRNRDYGTQVVAGVTPGKGGQDVDGIPVFDTVADAVRETGANTSMVFVPPRFAADAHLRGGRRRHRHRSSASPRASRPTTCSASTRTCGRAASGCSGPTAPARSRPASPTSGSSRRRCSPAAASASSRARAR